MAMPLYRTSPGRGVYPGPPRQSRSPEADDSEDLRWAGQAVATGLSPLRDRLDGLLQRKGSHASVSQHLPPLRPRVQCRASPVASLSPSPKGWDQHHDRPPSPFSSPAAAAAASSSSSSSSPPRAAPAHHDRARTPSGVRQRGRAQSIAVVSTEQDGRARINLEEMVGRAAAEGVRAGGLSRTPSTITELCDTRCTIDEIVRSYVGSPETLDARPPSAAEQHCRHAIELEHADTLRDVLQSARTLLGHAAAVACTAGDESSARGWVASAEADYRLGVVYAALRLRLPDTAGEEAAARRVVTGAETEGRLRLALVLAGARWSSAAPAESVPPAAAEFEAARDESAARDAVASAETDGRLRVALAALDAHRRLHRPPARGDGGAGLADAARVESAARAAVAGAEADERLRLAFAALAGVRRSEAGWRLQDRTARLESQAREEVAREEVDGRLWLVSAAPRAGETHSRCVVALQEADCRRDIVAAALTDTRALAAAPFSPAHVARGSEAARGSAETPTCAASVESVALSSASIADVEAELCAAAQAAEQKAVLAAIVSTEAEARAELTFRMLSLLCSAAAACCQATILGSQAPPAAPPAAPTDAPPAVPPWPGPPTVTCPAPPPPALTPGGALSPGGPAGGAGTPPYTAPTARVERRHNARRTPATVSPTRPPAPSRLPPSVRGRTFTINPTDVCVAKLKGQELGLRLSAEGLVLVDVKAGSPADRSGLRNLVGQRLTHVDGAAVRSPANLGGVLPAATATLRFDPAVLTAAAAPHEFAQC
eukprot:TRINITY_DN9921_c0_g1_i1.p1 TRINITY_DN9921_c0_g1~~TRINITY_DN9921_c0_g1_i1.p1  ORF type:complete len:778 (+),score=200.09 TRINITY_DN9921_c0_g1_i1:40-2373(+)